MWWCRQVPGATYSLQETKTYCSLKDCNKQSPQISAKDIRFLQKNYEFAMKIFNSFYLQMFDNF